MEKRHVTLGLAKLSLEKVSQSRLSKADASKDRFMKAKLCFKLISAAEYRKDTCFAAMFLSTSAKVRRLKCLQRLTNINIISTREAKVAELVDAADSKSAASDSVWVRVPSLAPLHKIKKSSSGAFFMSVCCI